VAVWRVLTAAGSAFVNSPIWGLLKSVGSAAVQALVTPAEAVRSAFEHVLSVIKDVISWIGRIKFPSAPSWLPGVGKSSVVPGAPPSVASARSPSLARSGWTPAGSSSVVINVTGVLDGADAARKIRAVLRDDERRRTGVQLRTAGAGRG
jgi:hypothetical protein